MAKDKFKDFFSNRRNVIIMISVVSFLIIILIGLFFYLVYTKNEPSFVPEETKGEIRKGIEQNIGENVKKVAPDLGQSIIDASYDNQKKVTDTNSGGSVNQLNPDTADATVGWVEYKDVESGVTLKYPPALKSDNATSLSPNQISSTLFWNKATYKGPQNGSFPEFELDVYSVGPGYTRAVWIDEKNNPVGMISDVKEYNGWTKAVEAGDPDHLIFFKVEGGMVIQITTSLAEPSYLDEVLESLRFI